MTTLGTIAQAISYSLRTNLGPTEYVTSIKSFIEHDGDGELRFGTLSQLRSFDIKVYPLSSVRIYFRVIPMQPVGYGVIASRWYNDT
jgi:hypothetical protein